jgi:hypothetical protein
LRRRHQLAKEVLGTVPYPIRMAIIRRASPAAYDRAQTKRTGQTAEGHSFRHFFERQCIFIHIPKAAGISIARSLFPEDGGSDYLGPGHATMADYRLWLTRSELDSFFKFTFVRNPWDRAYSAYRYLKRGGMNPRDQAWARENLDGYPDFDTFVKRWMSRKNVLDALHFRPQYSFFTLPIGRQPCMDFVGYFERLEEDYRYVRARVLGEDSDVQLVHANRSSSPAPPSYLEVYSDEAREIVADVYRNDIALLGYTFDGLEPRDGLGIVPDR